MIFSQRFQRERPQDPVFGTYFTKNISCLSIFLYMVKLVIPVILVEADCQVNMKTNVINEHTYSEYYS